MSAISSALAGIAASQGRLDSAALRLSGGSVGLDGAAGVDSADFSSAMIELLQARAGTSIAVKVAHVAQDVQKSLLSVFG